MKKQLLSVRVRKILNIHDMLFDVPWLKTTRHASVLIMVLWILVVISFLAGEYVATSRSKSAIAANAQDGIHRKAAARCVLALVESGHFETVRDSAHEKNLNRAVRDADGDERLLWTRLSPGGVPVFVKVEAESSRIELKPGNEKQVFDTLAKMYGEDNEETASSLSDAIFDWMDEDDMVRLNGAEKEYYQGLSPPLEPGNGPFKTMSEVFLVRGMDLVLFWGEPQATLNKTASELSSFQNNSKKDSTDRKNSTGKKNGASSGGGMDIASKSKKSITSGGRSTGMTGASDSGRDKDKNDEDDDVSISSFLEGFTVYPENTKRVSMLFPDAQGFFWHEVYFLKSEGRSLKVLEHISSVFP